MSRSSWWAAKVRQFRAHLVARVDPAERAELEAWTTPGERSVFDVMTVADRRHGLDVVATLRSGGVTNRDVLVAGLLHDAGKGPTGLGPRIAYSLGQAYGPWAWRLAATIPGWRVALERLRTHAERSASLAAQAGCSERTVALIRDQEAPRDPEYGELFRRADEAN